MDDIIGYYIDISPSKHRGQLIQYAHQVITSTLPHHKLSFKWNVPFYSYLKDLCYINCYKEHIYVSFMQGQLLNNHPLLMKNGSKMVAKYYIHDVEDIIQDDFLQILLEACTLQESMNSKK